MMLSTISGGRQMNDERRISRDEMNLAEFPLGLLVDRPAEGIKTLVFEGEHGLLTITGSDAYGLPSAPDADVIVALLHLTKVQNNFISPNVTFTRYELLRILGWSDKGRDYQRLEDSLKRWVGVTLFYAGSWWDNAIKCRADASFHILESVTIYDQATRRTLQARGQTLPQSIFTWGTTFFASCQADNLKRLDLDTYFGLRSAVSKQLYRFLDKRFYLRRDWTFDLNRLAIEHVGLSRNYTAAKLKEKIRPALLELEAIGYLVPMTAADRYLKTGRGRWNIRVVRASKACLPSDNPGIAPLEELGRVVPDVVAELIARGVTPAAATQLAGDYPFGRIAEKLDIFDWLMGQKGGSLKRNPAGWLFRAIVDNFAAPAGYLGKTERAHRERQEQDRQERQGEERRAKTQARADADRIREYWSGLTAEARRRFEAEAVAAADAETRAGATLGPLALRRLAIVAARDAHARRILGLPPA